MSIQARVQRARELCGCTACLRMTQPEPCTMAAAIFQQLSESERRGAAYGVCTNRDHSRMGAHVRQDRCVNWQFTHTSWYEP